MITLNLFFIHFYDLNLVLIIFINFGYFLLIEYLDLLISCLRLRFGLELIILVFTFISLFLLRLSRICSSGIHQTFFDSLSILFSTRSGLLQGLFIHHSLPTLFRYSSLTTWVVIG